METPLFFSNENYRLFGVLHIPDNRKDRIFNGSPSVLLCHPFAEEKLTTHRIYVNFARFLTEKGISCFRFDYMGHGDSEGNFEESTVESRLSDINCAINQFRNKTEISKLILLGFRFGGTLAAMAGKESTVDSTIMISPIVSGNEYMNQCLRSNLTTQMATYKRIIKTREDLVNDLRNGEVVNFEGYLITRALFEQIISIDLLKLNEKFSSNSLVLQLVKSEYSPDDKKMYAFHNHLKTLEINTFFHKAVEVPVWKDLKTYTTKPASIFQPTFEWIKTIYGK